MGIRENAPFLLLRKSQEAEVEPALSKLSLNILPLVVWISLVGLSFVNNEIVPHGVSVEQLDQEILQNIIQNPVHPAHVNELYFTLFNVFGPLPVMLSALILPQEELRARSQSLDSSSSSSILPPPQPFLLGSAALGYFVLGLYLALRPPLTKNNLLLPKVDDEWSWYTRNLWENRVFHAGILLFLFYLPFGSNAISVINEQGWNHAYQDFCHFLSTSRFATISCMDLCLLHLTSVSLIPLDFALRSALPTAAEERDTVRKGNVIALLALLVPFVGPAVYIALRPPLLAKE